MIFTSPSNKNLVMIDRAGTAKTRMFENNLKDQNNYVAS